MALPKKHSCSPDRALEMRMRDVLDGLEELACLSSSVSSQQVMPDGLEILSIEPAPEKDPVLHSTRATIHSLPLQNRQNDRADIADWLIRQEQKT
ncbi:hypothetical protein MNBD_GAMMA24-709 [hydrothermal vent metagenome]|uniref:Uncharacterized protein n=1 Tax=hydrothermal vent metagenome TaxID=652676 RepID=A0A3B1BBK9_9ZZZZ